MAMKPIKDKTVMEMSYKEFFLLPARKWGEDIGTFDTLVILPMPNGEENDEALSIVATERSLSGKKPEHLHDSGFRLLDFVAVKSTYPICRLSGCSDVLYINGVGGFGYDLIHHATGRIFLDTRIPEHTIRLAWSIDCLPKSGLLQLFCTTHLLRVDAATSSFSVYAIPRKEEKKCKRKKK